MGSIAATNVCRKRSSRWQNDQCEPRLESKRMDALRTLSLFSRAGPAAKFQFLQQRCGVRVPLRTGRMLIRPDSVQNSLVSKVP